MLRHFNKKGASALRKGIKVFLGLLIVITILLSGCIVVPPINPGQWVLKDHWQHYLLSEHYYTYSYSLYVGSNNSQVKISVNCSTSPNYGFEIWIMTENQFADFVNSDKVSVVAHFTAYSGSSNFYSSAITPGQSYRVVIDNTDYGWVKTNWDGWDDYCRFDANVYFYTN